MTGLSGEGGTLPAFADEEEGALAPARRDVFRGRGRTGGAEGFFLAAFAFTGFSGFAFFAAVFFVTAAFILDLGLAGALDVFFEGAPLRFAEEAARRLFLRKPLIISSMMAAFLLEPRDSPAALAMDLSSATVFASSSFLFRARPPCAGILDAIF
jgi:hypothetical protein